MSQVEGSSAQVAPLAGAWVAAAWIATFALAYFTLGGLLGRALEGNDTRLLSKLPIFVTVLAALASLAVTVAWARGAGRTEGAEAPAGLGRRRFLIGTAASLGGLIGTLAAVIGRNRGWLQVTLPAVRPRTPTHAPSASPDWEGARVREYRRLGRTEFRVSDISLGSSRIHPERGGEEIARAAIERGVNYFDTAPDYSETGSELALGRALSGHRDKMFLATKFCTANGHLPAGMRVSDYVEAVDASLERLQTDYVDLVHIHACDDVSRLLDERTHEAFDRLKEQGKARFLGVSTHTPNLVSVANAAIDSGRFDVMMLAYHHGAWPELGAIIDRAAGEDMGVVAMKTLKGARHQGLLESRAEADSYTQAAFKWVLENPSVGCLVVSFWHPQHVDEYLYASGARPSPRDHALLQKYDRLNAGKHCFQHCGACLDACPEELRIDDVLRYRMYFEDYGDEKEAMRLYAQLERKADACMGCSAPCASACPHGVPIPERTRGAHALLTLG